MKILASSRMQASKKPSTFAEAFGDIFAKPKPPSKESQAIRLQKESRDLFQQLARLRGIDDAIIKQQG